MGLKSISIDTEKSAYVFLYVFLHLMLAYRRKQVNSYILVIIEKTNT